jgi:hypothetical protein
LEQTPAVHIDGLEHRVFWDEPPVLAKVLEENYEDVRWGADRLFGAAAKGAGWELEACFSSLVQQWHSDTLILTLGEHQILKN